MVQLAFLECELVINSRDFAYHFASRSTHYREGKGQEGSSRTQGTFVLREPLGRIKQIIIRYLHTPAPPFLPAQPNAFIAAAFTSRLRP